MHWRKQSGMNYLLAVLVVRSLRERGRHSHKVRLIAEGEDRKTARGASGLLCRVRMTVPMNCSRNTIIARASTDNQSLHQHGQVLHRQCAVAQDFFVILAEIECLAAGTLDLLA